jgi:DNA-binding GntR family transcriptional regulator
MSPAKSDRPDRRPPYQHAADAIRKEIRAGRLKPGEQLPSLRELQERFGIANMTMRAALNLLREEGLIYTIQGRGSFVADVGELPHDYAAPAWYLARGGAESEEEGATLTEVLTSLRNEVRHLSAEHQDLKREVEELKAQVHAGS